ncbi:hypothetical protein [Roseibium sp.]|uniref:hypothetical protein n=1 Tax=Roseibium sp. TaxID=1936156 RepID=UPI003D11A302
MSALAGFAETDCWDEQGSWKPDFRVAHLKNTKWQIAILSPEASRWARERMRTTTFAGEETLITDDLSNVNMFVSAARRFGMKVEYVGPHQVVRF